MRHGYMRRKLKSTPSSQRVQFRNQLATLIEQERVVTTLPKAKELRPLAEKLITLAKQDSVHARRQAARVIGDEALIAKLFDTLGPRNRDRPGGYVRVMKLGARRGDAAEMAILELVERTSEPVDTPFDPPAMSGPNEPPTPPVKPPKGRKKKPTR